MNAEEYIGKKVWKKSRKPFKSKNQINTVKGTMNHPVTGRPALTFHEDDSYVESYMVELYTKE